MGHATIKETITAMTMMMSTKSFGQSNGLRWNGVLFLLM